MLSIRFLRTRLFSKRIDTISFRSADSPACSVDDDGRSQTDLSKGHSILGRFDELQQGKEVHKSDAPHLSAVVVIDCLHRWQRTG